MIRLLDNPADVDAVIAMTKEMYPNEFCPEDDLRRRILVKHPCWLYEVDGKLAGMLASDISQRQPYIWSVATYPEFRGKGIATQLLTEFEKHYTGLYSYAWLHVRTENPAQKLYFDMGYRVASFERNIYGVKQHGITMRKSLLK